MVSENIHIGMAFKKDSERNRFPIGFLNFSSCIRKMVGRLFEKWLEGYSKNGWKVGGQLKLVDKNRVIFWWLNWYCFDHRKSFSN